MGMGLSSSDGVCVALSFCSNANDRMSGSCLPCDQRLARGIDEALPEEEVQASDDATPSSSLLVFKTRTAITQPMPTEVCIPKTSRSQSVGLSCAVFTASTERANHEFRPLFDNIA